ncbi:hypothetical protein M433DRAFT_379948 [Acidomyces richmondensis BFW]|nr:MAG: hypothetical protein FE78DRAFT_321273 [Acidomyces sp. 'richmondensis']KYG48820.1 hypothetical protein M433DRAFT_379948 [Acidomyces richmondensis BFW]
MNPADLQLPTISPNLTSKTSPTLQLSALKNPKPTIPRVDVEPIYTHLKAVLGDGWADYKTALNAFILGNLNQAELSWVLQPLLSTASSSVPPGDSTRPAVSPLHLHNTLVASLYANIHRDPPPTDVAPWVVATDKPTALSKNAGASGANDEGEERLKKEVMALPARDRRRIKSLKDGTSPLGAINNGLREIQAYHNALDAKPHHSGEDASEGVSGMTRTNWDLESRRRYAQPLACETLEFPTVGDVQSRIDPIAAEEGLVGATQSSMQACADMIVQGAEVHLKELIGNLLTHTRSNGEGCIQTANFRRQLQREEDAVERGLLQRNPAGLLPVEVEVQNKREPLFMQDFRLAIRTVDDVLRRDKFAQETSMLKVWPSLHSEAFEAKVNGFSTHGVGFAMSNGPLSLTERSAMVEDSVALDEAPDWQGGTLGARSDLMSVLDDCLAVG